MNLPNWQDISYLKKGSLKQRKVFDIITQHNFLVNLSNYNPLLVSTICLGIDIKGSDIDIICESNDCLKFSNEVKDFFSQYSRFHISIKNNELHEAICSFYIENIEVEIYSSSIAVKEQYGYRHFNIMHRLLALGGQSLSDEIISLIKTGLKTEPAFAKKLKLEGNPYEVLLELEAYKDTQLRDLLKSVI